MRPLSVARRMAAAAAAAGLAGLVLAAPPAHAQDAVDCYEYFAERPFSGSECTQADVTEGETPCGCARHVTAVTIDAPPDCSPQPGEPRVSGEACTGAVQYGGDSTGLEWVTVTRGGERIEVNATGRRRPAIGGDELGEFLHGAMELLQPLGRSFGGTLTALAGGFFSVPGGPKYVAESDLEVDFGDVEYSSLEVRGLYFVLGKITVTGPAEIYGFVAAGDGLEAETVSIRPPADGPVLLGGIHFGSLKAQDVLVNHGFVFAPELWSELGGAVEASRQAVLTGAYVNAGTRLYVGVPGTSERGALVVTDSNLLAREIVADSVTVTGSRVDRPSLIDCDSLLVQRSDLSGSSELRIVASTEAAFDEGNVTAGQLDCDFGAASVSAGSRFTITPTELSELFSPSGEDDMSLPLDEVTGGSYGGYGGTEGWLAVNSFRPAWPPVGSMKAPDGGGVGGFGHHWNERSKGGGPGGMLILRATSLVWDGEATARGADAPGPSSEEDGGGSGGGSGGTIRFEIAGALSGAGTLSANGGQGSHSQGTNQVYVTGGGGSGGRIAVTAGRFDQLMRAEAIGGRGGRESAPLADDFIPAWRDFRNHGGPGTVYWKASGLPGRIEIDGHGLDPAAAGCTGLGPRCLGIGRLAGDLSEDDVVLRHATVATTGLKARSLTLEDAALVPDDPRVRLHWPLPELDYEGVDFTAAQVIYPAAVWRDGLDEKLAIEVGQDVSVDRSSSIDVSGFGGYSRVEYFDDGLQNWAGGSHGGRGGAGRHTNETTFGSPDAPFGSETQPTMVGQGGYSDVGWSGEPQQQCGLGGIGGGALRIVVGGTAMIDGGIVADGGDGRHGPEGIYCISQQGTAAGAGGSVWLTAARLEGGGVVGARGGDGGFAASSEASSSRYGGGGGGGRVAVYADRATWNGTLTADGGRGGAGLGVAAAQFQGEPGTVYVEPGDPEPRPPSPGPASPRSTPPAAGCSCGHGASPDGSIVGLVLLAAACLVRPRRRPRS